MESFGVALARTVCSVSCAARGAFTAAGAKLEPSFVSVEAEARDGPAEKLEASEVARADAAGVVRTASLEDDVVRGRDRERWRLTAFIYELSVMMSYSCFHPPTFRYFGLQ
jgi:hypothetical protein